MAEVFPETINLVYPLAVEPEFRTVVSETDGAAEQRRSKWVFPRFNVRGTARPLSATAANDLWNFYIARRGSAEAFWFYDRTADAVATAWKGLYVGVGDGATTIFDLPGKSTSSRTVYLDGVSQSTGFEYLTGGGDGSADRVSFTVAPAAGVLITCDFTGRLRIRCRFNQDRLSRSLFMTVLFEVGLELRGLPPA